MHTHTHTRARAHAPLPPHLPLVGFIGNFQMKMIKNKMSYRRLISIYEDAKTRAKTQRYNAMTQHKNKNK